MCLGWLLHPLAPLIDHPCCHPDWEPSSVVGWEANSSGKLAPRQVDLGASMDPRRLAESAVTLNVSLMRWRAAPSLGIDRLQDLKILLLGAGTMASFSYCFWCRRLGIVH